MADGHRGSDAARITALLAVTLLVATVLVPGPGAFAVTLRSASSTNTSSGGHIDLDVPAGTQVGDLMLVTLLVKGGSAQAITPPSGWTLVLRTNDGSSIAQASYYKFYQSGEPTTSRWAFTSPEKKSAGIMSFGDVDATNPIAAAVGQVNPSSSTSVTAPSVTVTSTGARLVGVFGTSAQSTFTPPTGMSEIFDLAGPGNGGPSLMVAHQELAASGATGTRTATSQAGDHNIGQSIALQPISRAPIANAGADQTVDEDALATLDGTGSSDPNGGSLTYTWTQTSGTAVTLSSTTASRPTFTAPTVAPAGAALIFQLRVTNSAGLDATDAVTIAVQNVNQAPVALDNAYTVTEDTAFTLVAPGVLVDDTDADGDSLTATLVDQPVRGVVGFNADGSFTYTPNTNVAGTDSFTYKAQDASLASNLATVQLTIGAVNDAPTANADAYTLAEDAALTVPAGSGVLANDADVEGSALSAVLGAGPASGTLTLNADGSFTYEPQANFNGADSFTYRASDGAATSGLATASLTVTSVNDVPAVGDDSYTLAEDASATTLDVLANDADADGDGLSVSSITTPSHGTATIEATGILYTPAADYAGSDAFTYTVTDGQGATGTARVSITVTSVNDAPVLAPIGAKSVAENQVLSFAVTATDVDGTPTVSMSGAPAGSTFADGDFTWQPNFSQAGSHTVTFTATDGSLTDTEAVTITVANTNRAPVLDTIGSKSTNENQLLAFTVTASDPDGGSPALTTSTLPSGAAFTASSGAFAWTPGHDQSGSYSVTFTASDGSLTDTETITITVEHVNRAPVLAPIGAQTVLEGNTLAFTVSGADDDGDTLTYSATGLPSGATFNAATRAFNWPTTYTNAGSYTVTFSVADSRTTDSEDVTITVTNVNRAPELAPIGAKAVDEGATLAFTVTASDPDGGSPTLSAASLPTGATFTPATGAFSWSPGFTQSGGYTVTFAATDGSLTDSEAVTITVGNTNRAPVLAAIGSKSVGEGQALTFTVTASDPDGGSPALTTSTLPSGAGFTGSNGAFSWTPGYDQSGSYSVTFTASDGSLTDAETITITVAHVNRAPVLASIGAKAVLEGETLAFTVSGSDDDGDTLTYSATGLPSGATFGAATRAFSWSPGFTQAGAYTVTFTTTDGGMSDSEAVAITVTNVNRAPELAAIGSKSVDENAALAFTVTASDPDGGSPTLSASSLPAGASFTPSSGAFSWTPGFTQSGIHSVTFTASDGSLTDTETVAITVNNVNRAPVLATVGSKAVAEATTLSFTLSGSDPDGTGVTYSSSALPGSATLDAATGAFSWTTTHSDAGTYAVTFTVSDGSLTDAESIQIAVGDTPRAPELASIGDKTVAEAATLTFTVSASDADGDAITYSASGVPSGASFDPSTRVFAWTPSYTQASATVYSVTFTATAGGQTDSETIAITVSNVNRLPEIAAIAAKTVAEGQSLAFTVTASDPDGGTPTLAHQGIPSGATFSGGQFSWVPGYTQASSYSVTFTATDADGGVDTETVAITVTNTNRAPVLAAVGAKSGTENAALVFVVSATDDDGDTLTYAVTPLPAGASFGAANGEFRWTPDFDDAATYPVSFSVTDGTATDSESVTITIANTPRAPELASIGDKTVAEAATLTFTVSASDADGDPVTYSASGLPAGASLGASNGAFSWTPSHSQASATPYGVTFTATAGGQTDSETIGITVSNVNRLPEIAAIAAKTVAEGQSLAFTVTASDPDGGTPTVAHQGLPSGASLTGGQFSWVPGYTQASASAYSVTFTATDADGGVDTETVAITVTNTNRAPVLATVGTKTGTEDMLLVFVVSATDDDGDTLTYAVTPLPPGASFGAANGEFRWTPDFDDAASYPVSFSATDGTATDTEPATITIANQNRAPELDAIGPRSGPEGTLLTFVVTARDADGGAPTLSAAPLPTGATLTGGTFSWTPTHAQAGTYEITFTAADADRASDTERVILDIANANRAPELDAIGSQTVAEGATLTFTAEATDPDGDDVTLTLSGLPPGATFAGGVFSWTPGHDQAQTYSVTITASDGSLSDAETFSILVTNVNRAPVLDAIGDRATSEGVLARFFVTATDADGDSLTLSAPVKPAGATFDPATGEFRWTPTFAQAGDHPATFLASDGPASASETLNLEVANVNRAPVLAPIGPRRADEAASVAFTASATDADLEPVTLAATPLPTGATFDAATGGFAWTPTHAQAGTYTISVTATDGAATDSELVVLTIVNVNRAPELAPIGDQEASEGTLLSIPLSAEDPDGDTLTYTALGMPLGATLDASTGAFAWTPSFTQAGTVRVTFEASDGEQSDSEAINIVVANTNRAPILGAIGDQAVAEGALLVVHVTASDPDGTSPTLAASGLPSGATFDLTTGDLRWTPDFSQAGSHTATFTASDGDLTDLETIAIVVANTPVPQRLLFASQPTTQTSLAPFETVVHIVDEDGELASDATRTVTLALREAPADGVLYGSLSRAATGGVATFPGLSLDESGTYTLSAAAIGLQSAMSEPIAVTPGAAAGLAFQDVPSAAASDSPFPLKVRVEDAAGNLVPTATHEVTLRIATGPSSGVLGGSTATAVGGVASFAAVTLSSAGTYTLGAQATGLAGATSAPITVTATPSHLVIEAAPTSATSMAAFSVTVHVVDGDGQVVTGATNQVRLSIARGPANGILRGETSRAAQAGVASFPGLTLDRVGTYGLVARSSGLPDVTASDLVVGPGAPFAVELTSVPEAVTTGHPFSATVRVHDAAGNLVPSATNPVLLLIKTGPVDAELQGTTERNAAAGVAAFEDLRLSKSGAYVLGAASDGLTSSLSPTIRVNDPTPDAIEVIEVADAGTELRFAGEADNSGADGKPYVQIRRASVLRQVDSLVFDMTLNGPFDYTRPAWYEVRLDADKDGTAERYLRAAYRPGATGVGTWQACAFDIVGQPDDAPASATFDPSGCATTGDDRLRSDRLGPASGGVHHRQNGLRVAFTLDDPADATDTGRVTMEAGLDALLAWLPPETRDFHVQFYALGSLSFTPPLLVDLGPVEVVVLVDEDTPAGAITMTAGTRKTFVAIGLDAEGQPIPGLVFEWVLPADTRVASADGLGRVTAHAPGTAELRARLGTLQSAPITITVAAGTLAQLRLLPGSAAMEAGVPVDFLAQGFDAQGNPVSLGNVEWFVDGRTPGTVLGPLATFTFAAGQSSGAHEVTARSGGFTRSAIVVVTSTVAPADTLTILPASSVAGTIDGVSTSTVVAGVLQADRDATLSILPPIAEGTSDLLVEAQVTLERPSQNLAIIIETQLGDLTAPPPETNPAELAELLNELSASGTPGVFLRVSATEGGQPLPSAALNQLLGTMDILVQVPVSYFTANGFDPERVRLIEYSDGRLVTIELFAERVGTTTDGLHHVYAVRIEQFSAFAILGAALKASGTAGPVPVVAKNPPNVPNFIYFPADPLPVATSLRTMTVRTNDPRISRVDFVLPAGERSSARVRTFDTAPTGVTALPAGVSVNRYFELHVDGPVDSAKVYILLPASEVPDPAHALLLHFKGGQWVPEARLLMERSGNEYVASAVTSCCSFFAIGFDRDAPRLAIAVPSTVATGLIRVPATASDNLRTEYVEYYVDGQLGFTDYEAPFEFLLNTARYANGTHEIRVLAYDLAGNIGEMAATATFRNARLDLQPIREAPAARTAAAPSGGLGLALLGPIAIAIVLAAGVAFALGRTRRTGEKALRNLLGQADVQKELKALAASGTGLQPLFGNVLGPKAGDTQTSESSDNPLIPGDWLR